jgi:D-aspartate ligase
VTLARSLGRQSVPFWVGSPPTIRLASFSRYTRRTLPWPSGDDETQVEYLLEVAARNNLDQWVLFPTSDETAALLSRSHSRLSRRYRVSAPTWNVLRWAYDKRLTYRLAADQQVDYPQTFYPLMDADLADVNCDFPAILKPAVHASINRLTEDKAWRVANREELLLRFREARELMPPDLILVQEMIPGSGGSQFSFAALCCDGKTIASLTARRTRQYPIDFGYSSSFVETMDVPEIVAPSQRLLAAIGYTGIVEVEYKFDFRDGRFKLLDINPRLWTWSPLGGRAGMDFPYLLWKMLQGMPVAEQRAPAGVRWVRMSTDLPAAFQEMLRGRLNLREYLRSLRGPLQFALVAVDDPLPGLMDLPIFAFKHLYNAYPSLRKNAATAPRVPAKS